MLKKFVFRVILFAFGFILIPTDYWHACEQHQQHTDQSCIDTQHDSCSICDFDLFQLDAAPFFREISPQEQLLAFQSGPVQDCVSISPSYCNKGPPQAL